jgi:hypothetical protein
MATPWGCACWLRGVGLEKTEPQLGKVGKSPAKYTDLHVLTGQSAMMK